MLDGDFIRWYWWQFLSLKNPTSLISGGMTLNARISAKGNQRFRFWHFPGVSHPSWPEQRVELGYRELSCPEDGGSLEKLTCLGHFCVWNFQLAQEACRPQLGYKDSKGNQKKCYLELLVNVARSTLARPRKRIIVCQRLHNKSAMKSQVEKDKVHLWTWHIP